MIVDDIDYGDGNRYWKVTTAPTVEPITVDEVKLFARIDNNAEDSLLESFIQAVREAAEHYLGRSLLNQTITLSMDVWPSDIILLPRPPLISITEVRTVDESGTATTYSSDYYYAITNSEPGKVVIKQDVSSPINTSRDSGGYEIEFLAGYGTTASTVPAGIREALKLWAAIYYENRFIDPKLPPPEARAGLDMYRVMPL